MCIHFPLHPTEKSIFKKKISFSLNCSTEADEVSSPLFLLKIKNCVNDCCHYLWWLWSPLLEAFFHHWNVCSVRPGSLPLHALPSATRVGALEAVHEFSTPPGEPGCEGPLAVQRCRVQWIIMKEKEPTVLSAGHKHWKCFGISRQFCSHCQTKYFFHLLFCDSYFFFPFFYYWENKCLTLGPDSSSVATALGGLCCDFLEES